jgi:hypothetical protein
LVLIKESGGPIFALAEVSHVWFYEMDANARDFIRSKFSDQLCIDGAEFLESKSGACYATLMQFSRVEKLDHVSCMKKDRRGWVVLTESGEQPSLFARSEF